MKQVYNVVDYGDFIRIGIKLNKDLKQGEWVNVSVPKNKIKDKSLDDETLLNY